MQAANSNKAPRRAEAGSLFTMDEVADQLRVSRRWLQDFLKLHPHYKLAGRKKLFTAAHVQTLVDCLPCPSNCIRPAKGKARTGASGYVPRS